MKRSTKDYAAIVLKGMAMGAADVVPGVSGGTIAFITGIYEEFIDSLKNLNFEALRVLFKEGIQPFWKFINGNFLLALGSGIFFSILTLAKLISYLLTNYPLFVWSFFFGLIVASAYVVGSKIKQWKKRSFFGIGLGILIAYFITVSTPAVVDMSYGYIFLSGFIAICAMILPGISGAFILLLMGSYAYVIDAIHNFKVLVLILFASGAVGGLMSFSRVLSWLFKKYHDATIALLTGFMIGSLNKVWPWKEVLQYRENSHGEQVPFIEQSVLPSDFNGDPQILACVVFAIIGFGLIFLLEARSNTEE